MADSKTRWEIDPAHSEIIFKARHLVISTVKGQFDKFAGWVETQGDSWENAEAYFEAEIDSVDTNNDQRDTHLKSDDFFNAEKYPKMTFRSTKIEKTGDSSYKMTGDLTMRDTTKKVELKVEHGGTATDPYGQTKAGFEINGKVNRKEFGLKWNAVTEAGNMVVSDEIRLDLNVQLTKVEAGEAKG